MLKKYCQEKSTARRCESSLTEANNHQSLFCEYILSIVKSRLQPVAWPSLGKWETLASMYVECVKGDSDICIMKKG